MKTQKLVIASAVCLFTAFGAFLQKKKSKPDFKKKHLKDLIKIKMEVLPKMNWKGKNSQKI